MNIKPSSSSTHSGTTPHMEALECVIALFDLYWFRSLILRRNPPSPPAAIIPTITVDSDNVESLPSEPLPRIATPSLLLRRHRRSRSDELAPVPALRIQTAKLQNILSGKEASEDPYPTAPPDDKSRERRPNWHRDRGEPRRRRKKGENKSLSDLEFEELKGLIDLGFTFSEAEAADPRLISIVPGLQRMGEAVRCRVIPPVKIPTSASEGAEKLAVSRPYLSEAWDAAAEAKERGDYILRNWRIPAVGKGVDLKDHLRLWAHSVASAVR